MPTADIPSFDLAACAALGVIFAVWVRRAIWISRFRKSVPPLPIISGKTNGPKISIIVPAKNEETNVARCLYPLFKQTQDPYEIIVVDDRSTDRTPRLLENFKELSPVPFKIVRVEKLPPGWTGKNYAMFTGSKAASGEWLLFTDADTVHRPESVVSALRAAVSGNIDLLTLAPETECRSFWEKTVQPLASASLALWFFSEGDGENRAGLANGQYILVKRSVYESLGGNEAVRSEVVEDVELAKAAMRAGFRVRFLNGTLLYSTRMYSSLSQIVTGWARIFTHLFEKKLSAIFHKIFLFLFFSCLPFFLFLAETGLYFSSSSSFSSTVLFASLIVCVFIVGVRLVGNRMVKSQGRYAIFHLLGSLVLVWVLFLCAFRIIFKRPSVWRGDSYA